MRPGLKIPRSYYRVWQLVVASCIAILVIASGWMIYGRLHRGTAPVTLSQPVSAKGNPTLDETPVTTTQVTAYTVPATHPRYLSIPSLGITNHRVVLVDVTPSGALDTPKSIDDIAWYDKGALPGIGTGVVVLDGHNGGATRDGVLAPLANLKAGSSMIIERGDGQKFTYTVQTNETMSYQDANSRGMQEMFTPLSSRKQSLSIITCAGTYDQSIKQFNKRIIVRAVLQ